MTRIRIRATTTRDWDDKELLIPNKEIVTGRLLNWSLTDTRLRPTLPVGVAYGSDAALALKILAETVADDISFPQRDVHLDSEKPLRISIDPGPQPCNQCRKSRACSGLGPPPGTSIAERPAPAPQLPTGRVSRGTTLFASPA